MLKTTSGSLTARLLCTLIYFSRCFKSELIPYVYRENVGCLSSYTVWTVPSLCNRFLPKYNLRGGSDISVHTYTSANLYPMYLTFALTLSVVKWAKRQMIMITAVLQLKKDLA